MATDCKVSKYWEVLQKVALGGRTSFHWHSLFSQAG